MNNNNVIKFDDPGRKAREMREQACQWLVRLDVGASPNDLRQIREWLDQDELHAKVLMEMALMWDQVAVLSELADIFPLECYADKKRSRLSYLLVAAGVVCLLLFWRDEMLLGIGGSSLAREPSLSLSQIHETSIGQQVSVDLPDGSEILLNTDTRIEIDFTAAQRHVILLKGEGHFIVAKDPSRPFRVIAGQGLVEAIGTAFTVQHLSQAVTEVTVVEGAVNVRRARVPSQSDDSLDPESAVVSGDASTTSEVSLQAGESARVMEQEAEILTRRMQPNEVEGRLAWRHGMLLFQGDPLDEVIMEVSRYTRVRIDVDDSVRDVKVVGYFSTGDVDGLLLTMRETFNVDVVMLDESHFFLRKK